MIHCKDCKHWDTSENAGSSVTPPKGAGICTLLSGGGCSLTDTESKYYDPKVLAEVAFGYDLVTRPEFGCVSGEEKQWQS